MGLKHTGSATVAALAMVLVAASCATGARQEIVTMQRESSEEAVAATESFAPDIVTPLVATPLAPVEPVLGSDGRLHLAYELFLTNASSSPLTLRRVEVVDAGRERVLGILEGDELDQAVAFLGGRTGPAAAPATVFRVFFDQQLAPSDPVPPVLVHRFTFTFPGRGGTPAVQPVVTSGRTQVEGGRGLVLGPPLEGARWWATGGCCFPPDYHRTATLPVNGAFHAPERFAIDFVRIQPDGRLYDGPRDQLSSYAYYGANVLAVADGRVVRVLDGLPDNPPGTFPPGVTAETAGGNYVVVDLGAGRYAFYAHLQPGSLRVGVGDTVSRGQVLGLLGNSGNSDAPHLHFHLMDGTGPLSSNGLAYRFDGFFLRGRVVTDPDAVLAGEVVHVVHTNRGDHRRELPLDHDLVDFAPAAA